MQSGVHHEHAVPLVFKHLVPSTNAIKLTHALLTLQTPHSTSTEHYLSQPQPRPPGALLSPFSPLTSASTMKLQVAVACLVVLLVVSETVVTSEGAGCNIYQLVPCMASSKNALVAPSKQCCTNIANMGKGLAGAKCLCSLLNHRLAKSNGVVPRIALGIPQKCRAAVPKGFVCQGTPSLPPRLSK
jgi:hypothetical protein